MFSWDPQSLGGLRLSLVWISKPVIFHIEEEVMLLSVFYYCICTFLCCYRSFVWCLLCCPISLFQGHVASQNFTLSGPPQCCPWEILFLVGSVIKYFIYTSEVKGEKKISKPNIISLLAEKGQNWHFKFASFYLTIWSLASLLRVTVRKNWAKSYNATTVTSSMSLDKLWKYILVKENELFCWWKVSKFLLVGFV